MQDGFDLYLHGFIVTDDGHWAVVQQGMNGDRRQARRYHWLSEGLASFVDAPHAAIAGEPQGEIVNLADRRAERSRRGQLDLLDSLGPDRIAREVRRLSAASDEPMPAALPRGTMRQSTRRSVGIKHPWSSARPRPRPAARFLGRSRCYAWRYRLTAGGKWIRTGGPTVLFAAGRAGRETALDQRGGRARPFLVVQS